VNGKTDIPSNFDWVKARADCSPAQVFKELEFGAKRDVDAANGQRKPGDLHAFKMASDEGCFSVIRESSIALPVSVEFYLERDGIKVTSGAEVNFVATLTLNNEGRCMLRVNGEELENWHVRRMALEDLFFGKGGHPMPRAGQ